MSKSAPAEAISNVNNEILTSREPYYIDGLSLDTHDIFCFDERGVADADTVTGDIEAVTPQEYIHAAGGGLGIVYNHAVVQEADDPFSVKGSFADHAGIIIPALIRAKVRPGVHSDVTAEGGNVVRPTAKGDVGCGYAGLRPVISRYIAENGIALIRDAASLRPELFEGPEDHNFAHAAVAANERLLERPGFITDGRSVVMAAAGKGSKIMLVEGRHTGRKGIINLVPGTSFDSDAANRDGLEAYNQDSWAIEDAASRIRHEYPHDKRHMQIAELIDALGTMRALDVEDVAVRRPEDLSHVV
jgi:hypothetical protein